MLAAIHEKLATQEEDSNIFIFPSFFRLLDFLDAMRVDYKVMFRTFGQDIPDITAEIQRRRPDVQFAHIELKGPNHNAATQRAILRAEHGDAKWVTVQENYPHWASHGFIAPAGKQLCLNNDPRVLDVFFDDCVERKNMIHVVAPNGATIEKVDAINRGHLVDVDTLEAIYDDAYFIKNLGCACDKYLSTVLTAPSGRPRMAMG